MIAALCADTTAGSSSRSDGFDVQVVRDVVDVRDERPFDGIGSQAQVEVAEGDRVG